MMNHGRWILVLIAIALMPLSSALGRDVAVGIEADRTEMTLTRGDVLEIQLPGNRTTGYLWEINLPESGKYPLRLLDQGTLGVEGSDGTPKVGAPGLERFLFKATHTGKEVLLFRYRRPWEKEPPAQTFELRVRIITP